VAMVRKLTPQYPKGFAIELREIETDKILKEFEDETITDDTTIQFDSWKIYTRSQHPKDRRFSL